MTVAKYQTLSVNGILSETITAIM